MDPQPGDQLPIAPKRAGRYYFRLARAVLVDATWLRFAYFVITLFTCAQVMFRSSIGVGFGALGGAALCFLSAATFVGSYRARREQSYCLKDLAGIGATAAVLCGAGFALMLWTGWRITIYGLVIPGFIWAIVGIVIAVVTTTKKDVAARTGSPTSSDLSAEAVVKIIQDYRGVFAIAWGTGMDSSSLPHPKKHIKQALAFALRHASDSRARTDLAAYYLGLADWQPGIGDAAATFIAAASEADPTSNIRLRAERISRAGAPFQKWIPVIAAERTQLLVELESLLSPTEIEEMRALIERPEEQLKKLLTPGGRPH